MVKDGNTISRDQFKRLSEQLLEELPVQPKTRSMPDPKMNKQSFLLKALYERLQEKLQIPKRPEITHTDFPTYEFAYRKALYELINQHAKEPFEYMPIVDSFLERAKKSK